MLLSSYDGSQIDRAQNIISQAIKEIISNFEAQIAELKARADDSIPVIKTDIELCTKATGSFYCDISSYKRRDGYYTSERTADEVLTYVTKLIDDAIVTIEAIHSKNLPSLENNKIVRTKLEKLLQSIGLPDSYRERDYKSKARFPKYISVPAGYKKDLSQIVVDDGYESALFSAQQHRERLKTWFESAKREEQARQLEAEKKEQEIKKSRQFGVIAERYNLTENDTEQDLLDAILSKNKYLRLGHYLLKNREDSIDGPSYAERGLREFIEESEIDKLIAADIQSHIDNWDGDGRCFRDTIYNYDFCFNLVKNEQLYNDYKLVTSWAP